MSPDSTSDSACIFCAFLHVSLYSNRQKSLCCVFSFTRFSLFFLMILIFFAICYCYKKAQYSLFWKAFCLWIIPDSPNSWATTEMNPAHWGKRSHPLTYIPTLSFGYWTRFWLLTFDKKKIQFIFFMMA